jgi:NADH-quinone oxidoreductase subunit N
MYFDAPVGTPAITAPLDVRAVLSVNGALVLILGLVPGGLMTLCAAAVKQMLGA